MTIDGAGPAPLPEPKGTGPCVVVVGMEDLRGVHAARTLARHGVTVVGVTRDRRAYGARTRACAAMYEADTRSEAVIDLLEELGPGFDEPALIVPCTDMSMLVVTEHRHRLEPHYLMTLPPTDVVEVLTDKVAFYRYAQRHGHPIPATRFVGPDQPASEQVAGLRFPLAVKPPQSKDPRWLARTNVKAFRVTNPAELEQVVDEFLPVAGTLIVQEWIEGPETSLFACHGYFDQQGEPLVSFTSRKIRQWPVDTGQGSLAEEVRCEPARQITFDLFRGIGFSGLGYVEVKEDERTGAFLIVEPNIGRVSGRMAVAEAGGVELLLTMYCHATGRPLPEQREQQYRGAKWIFLRQDLQAAYTQWRRGQLTGRQWWRSVRGPKRFALLSWRDPLPFLTDLTLGLRLRVDRKEARRRVDPLDRTS